MRTTLGDGPNISGQVQHLIVSDNFRLVHELQAHGHFIFATFLHRNTQTLTISTPIEQIHVLSN